MTTERFSDLAVLSPNPIGVDNQDEVDSRKYKPNHCLNSSKKANAPGVLSLYKFLLKSIFALLIMPGAALAGSITNGDFATDLSG